jgi:hypothetical protein
MKYFCAALVAAAWAGLPCGFSQDSDPPQPKIRIQYELSGEGTLTIHGESDIVPEGAVVWFRLDREINTGSWTDPALRRVPAELEDTNAGYMRRGKSSTRFSVTLAGTYRIKVEVRPDLQPARVLREFQTKGLGAISEERKITVGSIASHMSSASAAITRLDRWMKEIENLVAIAEDPEIDSSVKARRATTVSGEMRTFERTCALTGSLRVLDTMAQMLFNTFAFTPQLIKGGKPVREGATAGAVPPPTGLNNAGNEDPNSQGEAGSSGGGGGGGRDATDHARDERLKWARKQMEKVRRVSARETAMILLERLGGELAGYLPGADAKELGRIAKEITDGVNYHDSWVDSGGETHKIYKSLTLKDSEVGKLLQRLRKYVTEGELSQEKTTDFLKSLEFHATELRARP